jgi:hypothetical protein
LLLLKLFFREKNDHAPRFLVGDFLEGSNQAKYLQIFSAFRHGESPQ